MPKGSSLDLLLIHPGGRRGIYQTLGSDLAAIEPPFWAGLMAAFVRRRGYSVAILDGNAQEMDAQALAREAAAAAPLLTAVVCYGHNPSASTQVMPAAGAICAALKETAPECKIILVGGHVAALPEQTMKEEAADFVAGGEGAYTLLDLIQALKCGQPDLAKVRGLYFREGGEVRSGPAPPLVVRLEEEMPAVAWDLLPMEKYRAHNWHCFGALDRRRPYASLPTTLGCPFHCTYCCIQAPFRAGERALGYPEGSNSYRFWSPQAVVAQIDLLVEEYGVRNLKLADEIFVFHPVHVKGICDLLIERGYDLNLWAYARVDTLKEDELARMRRAGLRWLCLGFESGSHRVRRDVRKGYAQERAYRAVDLLRSSGIHVIANFLFGLPEDDLATLQETLDFALELNCEFANFYCAMAYPGSRLYELARQEKWPLPRSWSGYSQHAVDTLPLPTRHLSGFEVLHFRDHAFQVYFRSPAYLERIARTFGEETVAHLREMAAHPLKRESARPAPRPLGREILAGRTSVETREFEETEHGSLPAGRA